MPSEPAEWRIVELPGVVGEAAVARASCDTTVGASAWMWARSVLSSIEKLSPCVGGEVSRASVSLSAAILRAGRFGPVWSLTTQVYISIEEHKGDTQPSHSFALLLTQFCVSGNCASYLADEPCLKGLFRPGRIHWSPFVRHRLH